MKKIADEKLYAQKASSNQLEIWERRRLRENSQELRDLKSKLRNEYWKKELSAQVAQNEKKKLEEKLKTLSESSKSSHEAEMAEKKYRRDLKQKEIDKKLQYRNDLQKQMIFKREITERKYEEFLREKSLIDSVVEKIRQEDEKILKEKWERKLKNKADMESFREAQKLWQLRRQEQIISEEEHIQKFILQKQLEVQQSLLQKRQKEDVKRRMFNMVAKHLCDEKDELQERELIQLELLQHEHLDSAERREREELEKKIKQTLEMKMNLNDQMRENELRRKQILQNEEEFEKMVRRNIEEVEKLEIMTAEKRRIKKIQLSKDLQEMIRQRKAKEAEEMKILSEMHTQELEASFKRNQLIKEERLRILNEHADHLIGYLPKEMLLGDLD